MAKKTFKIRTPKKKMDAVQRRLKTMPKMFEGIIQAKLKKDAIGVIKVYQAGLKRDSLGLERLKPSTIRRKQLKGLPMPENPLYGYGDRKKNSYYNLLYIQKLKNGYAVRPRWAKHHSSDLQLRQLFEVHEYGTTIVAQNGKAFRIPPRPAVARAYVSYVRSVNPQKEEKLIKQMINEYLRTGTVKAGAGMKEIERIARSFPKYANPN